MSMKQNTVAVYQRVTASMWRRMAPTFGSRTINAIAKSALARCAQSSPLLRLLRVEENDGIVWTEFVAHLDTIPDDELETMLDGFMDEFLDALSTLTGQLIADKIFAEARRESGQPAEDGC